jgi:hypothetical protein
VRWATKKQQGENKDSTLFIIVDGIRDSLKATCKRIGIPPSTLDRAMARGFTAQEVVDQWWRLRRKGGRLVLFPRILQKALQVYEAAAIRLTTNPTRFRVLDILSDGSRTHVLKSRPTFSDAWNILPGSPERHAPPNDL